MERISHILNDFKNAKILVIGDIMLDRYLDGDVSRINPEAPVPIVRVQKEFFELGGAANVASNIASLGGSAHLFGFAANDGYGRITNEILDKKGIKYCIDETSKTIVKTRITSKGQQLLRFDQEEACNLTFREKSREELINAAESADIIIISDYLKGTINQDLITLLSKYKKKIVVDPKPKNKELYKGILMMTPNEKEALEMSGENEISLAGKKIKDAFDCDVLITIGGKGMMLFSERTTTIPAYAREVYDVTGAGDTVISALALALAAGATREEAVIISNNAAGIAVEKKGTYSVDLKELKTKMLSEEKKIKTFEEIEKIVKDEKRKGRKIIWTNGCFDLLHIGHIKNLQEAKKLGDILIVGLNSDKSIRTLKGEGRPIQNENDRAEILSSLEFVDYVMIFPELSVENYLLRLEPDVFAKGEDYSLEKLENAKHPELAAIKSYGGKLAFLPLIQDKSTTNIIEKLKDNYKTKII